MVTELIAYESRVELHQAKYSGGYDDHYASKVQSIYRMSTQRRYYTQTKHTRMRAARLLQALQRGIIARKRYAQMKIEREKYLFYGFRSSLHHSTARMEDPKKRALEMAEEAERKRHAFLMQVLEGYVAENGIPLPYRVSVDLIETLFNEYGLVVGCPASFGEIVASFLRTDDVSGTISPRMAAGSTPREPSRLHTSGQISAALLLGLRSQYDDTFGLSSATRKIVAGGDRSGNTDEVPPRWLLKISPPFQRSNRNRLVVLRLSRKTAGCKAAHLVARDFRNMLQSESFSRFESCRAAWEASIRSRRSERRIYDSSTKEGVVQRVLDDLVASIKGTSVIMWLSGGQHYLNAHFSALSTQIGESIQSRSSPVSTCACGIAREKRSSSLSRQSSTLSLTVSIVLDPAWRWRRRMTRIWCIVRVQE